MQNNDLIKTIAGRILEDRCIIICGSELSALADECYSNNKIAEKFLLDHGDCFRNSRDNDADYHNKSLAEIIQLWINDVPDIPDHGDQNIIDHLSFNHLGYLSEVDTSPSTSHMILANLGCKYIYTTNYDCLIEKAYYKAGFPADTINIVSDDVANSHFRFEFPVVYKLCGTAGRTNLKLAARQFRPESINFRDEMRFRLLRRTILFIGYNQNDDIMLKPFVDIIKNSRPEGYYCVTQTSSTQPLCLRALGNAMKSIDMNIGDFFSQLYMELLSQTSDLFGYLSTKRKVIENSAIAFVRNKIGSVKNERIDDIKRVLDRHRQTMGDAPNLGNAWYWDFSFHQSLYRALPIQTFQKDFSEIYLKLRVFFSTYQSAATLKEHELIYQRLRDRDAMGTARSLNRHLRNVSVTASFWLQYFKLVNKGILQLALHDYRTPLETDRGILDERALREHNRILILGESRSGKTTYSVRQVVLSITTGSSIPIYIDLGSERFTAEAISQLTNQNKITQFLLRYFHLLELPSKMLETIIEEKVRSGGFLLVIDGMEKLEAQLARRLLHQICIYSSETTGLKVIITSQEESIQNAATGPTFLLEAVGLMHYEVYTLPAPILKTKDLVGTNCTLALVFTDIVGSVRMAYSRADNDERYQQLLNHHKQRVDTAIINFRGERVRDEGDAHLAVFRNVSSALDYALSLQDDSGNPEIRIRAGIHFAEVSVVEQQKINGLQVAYAKRVIEAIGSEAEIWLSTQAKAQIDQRKMRRFHHLKWQSINSTLKGFNDDTAILWKLEQNQQIPPK